MILIEEDWHKNMVLHVKRHTKKKEKKKKLFTILKHTYENRGWRRTEGPKLEDGLGKRSLPLPSSPQLKLVSLKWDLTFYLNEKGLSFGFIFLNDTVVSSYPPTDNPLVVPVKGPTSNTPKAKHKVWIIKKEKKKITFSSYELSLFHWSCFQNVIFFFFSERWVGIRYWMCF